MSLTLVDNISDLLNFYMPLIVVDNILDLLHKLNLLNLVHVHISI